MENKQMTKLSEYIFKEYNKSASALSIDNIEQWIFEWYKTEFNKTPPMWLVNWRKDGNKKK